MEPKLIYKQVFEALENWYKGNNYDELLEKLTFFSSEKDDQELVFLMSELSGVIVSKPSWNLFDFFKPRKRKMIKHFYRSFFDKHAKLRSYLKPHADKRHLWEYTKEITFKYAASLSKNKSLSGNENLRSLLPKNSSLEELSYQIQIELFEEFFNELGGEVPEADLSDCKTLMDVVDSYYTETLKIASFD